MKTKNSNMIILAFILAVCMMLILTGCKDKVQSTNAASSDTSAQEKEHTPYSYLPSAEAEDDELAEDPNEYPEEEPTDEVNEPDEEDPWNDEPEYPEDQPEEDSNENWL